MVLAMVTGSGSSPSVSSPSSPSLSLPLQPPSPSLSLSQLPPTEPANTSVKVDLKLSKAVKPKPVAATVSTFKGDDEEANKPVRTLIPLDYTEEERMAGSATVKTTTASSSSLSLSTKEEERNRELKEKQKQLVDQIPTDKAALYSYPLDWAVIERENIISTTVTPWVKKKMISYLGEEEDTLSDFISLSLSSHVHPSKIQEELEAVLDDETEMFVIKLWRMLIFAMLKAKL